MQPTGDPRIISFMTLRKAVGWFGISLPLAMMLVTYLFSNCKVVQDSISHYYYTVAGSMFVGILSAVALFLFAYKGYDKWDNCSTSLAGFFGFCIALFPTNVSAAASCNIVNLPPSEIRNTIHYTSAALFIITIACISLFLFTKSNGQKTEEKKTRNNIYKVSGITILLCLALIVLFHFTYNEPDGATNFKPVFWLEAVALFSFGISWLVKGEIVLKDKSTKE